MFPDWVYHLAGGDLRDAVKAAHIERDGAVGAGALGHPIGASLISAADAVLEDIRTGRARGPKTQNEAEQLQRVYHRASKALEGNEAGEWSEWIPSPLPSPTGLPLRRITSRLH